MRAEERCLTKPDHSSSAATYVFTPSFWKILPSRIRHCFSAADCMKLLLRIFNGYYVYYQTDGDKLMGYCFLKRNYLGKYSFLQPKDVLINPYFVSPAFRGSGLGGKLIEAAISDSGTAWETVYAVVKEDNFPSIRTLEKMNFQRIGYSEKHGWSHHLTERKTHLSIFRLTRSVQQEKAV